MSTSQSSSWQEVDRDLKHLAYALGATQSPREGQFNAALDEIAREHPEMGIPSYDEALARADELGLP